jgi:hypothetical protein
MAVAGGNELAVRTFDFEHFHATRPAYGFWKLVIDEHRYRPASPHLTRPQGGHLLPYRDERLASDEQSLATRGSRARRQARKSWRD